MAANRNRFTRHNQPRTCSECGKTTTDNAGGGTSLCGACFEAGGIANEHDDGQHDDQPHDGCPACKVRP